MKHWCSWFKKNRLIYISLACFIFYVGLGMLPYFHSSTFGSKLRSQNMLLQMALKDIDLVMKNSRFSTFYRGPTMKSPENMATLTEPPQIEWTHDSDTQINLSSSPNSAPKISKVPVFSMFSKFSDGRFHTFTTEKIPLKTPSISQIVPHLKNESSLIPAYRFTKGRTGVELVLGIPTVKRPRQNYLKATLKRLLSAMTPSDKNQTLIVILVAEIDQRYVSRVTNEILTMFSEDVESGLIDILSPPPSFYPDFESLPRNIDDDPNRFIWRSKQNLDYAFLMMYSQSKGKYYMQLEDDILSKNKFVPTILKAASDLTIKRSEWLVADFCELGFIGKLFRSSDLAWIIDFFLMFFKDEPCDWLLVRIVHLKVCRLDETMEKCNQRKKKVWIIHPQSLFQHIGVISSLKGKIQKLKASRFGRLRLFIPHRNPVAAANTSVSEVNNFQTIDAAYNGRNLFWGKMPKGKDYVSFRFKNPVNLTRYTLQSGNLEHPSDQFYNTDISVHSNNSDKHVVIGSFDVEGVASGTMPPELNPITELRLNVRQDSDNDVILSEVDLSSVSGVNRERSYSSCSSLQTKIRAYLRRFCSDRPSNAIYRHPVSFYRRIHSLATVRG